jgi:hypothetical protein
MHPMINEYVKAHYHFDGYGCGLCQTGVPCESKIPTAKDIEQLMDQNHQKESNIPATAETS